MDLLLFPFWKGYRNMVESTSHNAKLESSSLLFFLSLNFNC